MRFAVCVYKSVIQTQYGEICHGLTENEVQIFEKYHWQMALRIQFHDVFVAFYRKKIHLLISSNYFLAHKCVGK